jgi:MSHA biogenesis protein MshJ
MKELWLAQMARLDSLSLRERIFLFLSILLSCAAIVDTLWLSPAQGVHKQLRLRLEQQGPELQNLREALRSGPNQTSAAQSAQLELDQTLVQIEQVNQSIRQLLPGVMGAAPLTQALVHLLRHHDGLTLVRTSALAPELAGPGNSNGVTSLPVGLTRQGVSLTVAGPYTELTRYVASLELAMPYVRWGVMTLTVDKGVPELTLQLFLIGEVAP